MVASQAVAKLLPSLAGLVHPFHLAPALLWLTLRAMD
jgi:hypothetical protein